ncbi:hypothetical protein TRFO_07271 [Tritrichomonas foetus]|uniref:Uncharacterized protein n=1 Tax=Tritrichomonas foetus TaxID=1144522 RepID=A0A1J4JSH4_9EUKA|nr:hypothetical protein TRFO_07271 [Tritrichomonas foetus]|eukprot:OHT02087.1 hypothetical protein TRFO_07271 [Tritrichomonas foetus]
MYVSYKEIESLHNRLDIYEEYGNISNNQKANSEKIANFHKIMNIFRYDNDEIHTSDLFYLLNDIQFFEEVIIENDLFFENLAHIFDESIRNDLQKINELIEFMIGILKECDLSIEKNLNHIQTIIQISLHNLDFRFPFWSSLLELVTYFIKNKDCAHYLIHQGFINILHSLISKEKPPHQFYLLSLISLKKLYLVLDVNSYQYMDKIIPFYINYFIILHDIKLFNEFLLPVISLAIRNESTYLVVKSPSFFDLFLCHDNISNAWNLNYSFPIINAIIMFDDIEILNIPQLYQFIIIKLKENEFYINDKQYWSAISEFIFTTIRYQNNFFLESGLLCLLIKNFELMKVFAKFKTAMLLAQYILFESCENIDHLIEHGGYFILEEVLCNTAGQNCTLLIESLIKIAKLGLFEKFNLNRDIIDSSIFNIYLTTNDINHEEIITHFQHFLEIEANI